MINHYMNGTLILDEQDLSRMNYIIRDLSSGKETSITDILDTIYNSSNTINKLIRVAGRIYNSGHTFNGFETLHISKDKYKTYSYFVGSFPFETQLFELIGDNIELVIEDYTDSSQNMVTTEDVQYDNASKES